MPSRSVAPSLTITSLPPCRTASTGTLAAGQTESVDPTARHTSQLPRLLERSIHVRRHQRLAEADGRGLEQAAAELAVRILVALAHPIEGDVDGHAPGAVEADRLGRGPVQLDDIHGAGLLMKAVDVLGHHDRCEPRPLQPGDREVGGIRLARSRIDLPGGPASARRAPSDRGRSSGSCSAAGRSSSRRRSARESRGCPDSVEIPAPVKTRMRRAWRSHGRASARPASGVHSRIVRRARQPAVARSAQNRLR